MPGLEMPEQEMPDGELLEENDGENDFGELLCQFGETTALQSLNFF